MHQFQAVGLVVDAIEPGGMRRVRVEDDREKRGWYSVHELTLDSGDMVLVGSFGIWHGNENNARKIELKNTKLTSEQISALKVRIAEDRKNADLRRKADASRAALRAQKMWEKLNKSGESEYLKRKLVQGHGVRYSPTGSMAIPMLDATGRIHGLQIIRPKKRDGRDKEFWPEGLIKQGHFFHIGPQPTSVMLVAEGYSTSASLFEASGWPVIVAFDAGNIPHVVASIAKKYKGIRILICADDDKAQKCLHCKEKVWLADGDTCSHCGEKHGKTNAGVSCANAAALAVNGNWLAPIFSADTRELWLSHGRKHSDFNDLHVEEGLHEVRQQIETKIRQLDWTSKILNSVKGKSGAWDGESADENTDVITSALELAERFFIVYPMSETAFDAKEHQMVPLSTVRNLCVSRQVYRSWMDSTMKKIVLISEVGFDPSEKNEKLKCNLWGGWPTQPKEGDCSTLLELLRYLCSKEKNSDEVYDWIIKWLAYPIQYPGAKMKSALVMHGTQGTGKSMFFEACSSIYGEYARIIDQAAIEDKFNDWSSKKLFLIADEVVARAELFHIKNKLKGLITGDTLRINPKNMSSYEEANLINMVFLSNEILPTVLERDDRRHLVVWTPDKMDPAFYETVRIEMEHGGIEALHHYLLQVPLGDFKPWTLPPMTQSKADLIEVSMGSSEKFVMEWLKGSMRLPICACTTEDLYEAFRHWCVKNGSKSPTLGMFVAEAVKRSKGTKARKRYHYGKSSATRQGAVLLPGGVTEPADINALSDDITSFAEALRILKREDRHSHLDGDET